MDPDPKNIRIQRIRIRNTGLVQLKWITGIFQSLASQLKNF